VAAAGGVGGYSVSAMRGFFRGKRWVRAHAVEHLLCTGCCFGPRKPARRGPLGRRMFEGETVAAWTPPGPSVNARVFRSLDCALWESEFRARRRNLSALQVSWALRSVTRPCRRTQAVVITSRAQDAEEKARWRENGGLRKKSPAFRAVKDERWGRLSLQGRGGAHI